MTDMYSVPDTYTSFFGYERSASKPFGHRNVFFAERSKSRVSPFFLRDGVKIYEFPLSPEGDEPADEAGELVANDTRLLYEETRQGNGITIPHTSAMKNFGTNWSDNDQDVEPVVEIFQGCRLSSEGVGAPYAYTPDDPKFGKNYYPEGMMTEAWNKGYKLGVIASSDHISTHMSYAMVYTDDPTRQGILDAIRRRHTYAATDNIILDVKMGEHFMGEQFSCPRPQPLRVKVRGTGTVEKIDVIKDGRVLYTRTPQRRDVEFQFVDVEGEPKGSHYYYVRVQQDDGMIAWSSPMFVNYTSDSSRMTQ
jgi:hypothetical protein